MVSSTIRIAKAMKYPGAAQVHDGRHLPAIKDIRMQCLAIETSRRENKDGTRRTWYDEEEEEHPADEDMLIQQNMLGKEATDAAAAAIEKLPKMLVKT